MSRGSFYTYFASKEATVLEDDFDAALFELLRAQPPELSPIAAMRRAVAGAFGGISAADRADALARTELILGHPELKGAVMSQLVDAIDQLAGLFAERMGKPAEDVSVRTVAGAVVGALLAVTMSPPLVMDADFVGRMDAALAHLETALRLRE